MSSALLSVLGRLFPKFIYTPYTSSRHLQHVERRARACSAASNLAMMGSRSNRSTRQLFALLRPFPYRALSHLNSGWLAAGSDVETHYTKVQSHPEVPAVYICIRFRVLFPLPPKVLSPCPPGTGFLSLMMSICSLEDDSPVFRRGFVITYLTF